MNRHIALSIVVLVAVALAVIAVGCGDDDPYTGTWRDSEAGTTWVIAKANDGWWSIDNGIGGEPHITYAAEVNGELETTNGRNTFTPDGDKLHVSLASGATEFDLVRQQAMALPNKRIKLTRRAGGLTGGQRARSLSAVR